MESEKGEEGSGGASYRYWVRGATEDAVPLPSPRKLSSHDVRSQPPPTLGSVWNRAGTWEEKNLNKWATDRIKELLMSIGSLELSDGKAEISDLSNCVGDAFLVTVRNKKRVGYSYELTLKVKGEWVVKEETKLLKGDVEILEFSFGELDELQMQLRLSKPNDVSQEDHTRITQQLKLVLLRAVRQKLLQFEDELKHR
ncbi:hypothetical protein UlMin_042351 [Ulmus minor]